MQRILAGGIILMCLLFVCPAATLAAQAAENDATPGPGEIQLEGTIQAINPGQGFVLSATSAVLPGGKLVTFPTPRAKTVLIAADAHIHVRGSSEVVGLAELRTGIHAIVTGKDLGQGKELPARNLAVWNNLEGGVYRWNKPEPAVAPAGVGSFRPELALQLGHTAGVCAAAFSPDGNSLATAGDSTIKLWDARTGELRRTLEGHAGSVRSVAYSPDGSTLASGSYDRTIKLWNARTGELIKTLEGHTDTVYSVAFSPDGNTLASGSYDRTVKLWDARTGEIKKTLEGHSSIVWSVAYSPDGNTLASGSWDNTVRLWNARTGELEKTLQGHTNGVLPIAYSPDGNTLASGSWDKTIKLWNTRSGELMKTLEGHTDLVNSVAYSPDGSTLASGSRDNTVRLWDTRTGELKRTLEEHTGSAESVVFSPDGNTLVSGFADGTVNLWDVRTEESLTTLPGRVTAVNSVAFSPDGSMLASSSFDKTVKLWDARTGQLIKMLIGHTLRLYSAAFSPDGNTLASGGLDNTVKLWDVATGEVKSTLKGHTFPVYSVAFSPDGKTVASGSEDHTIKLWNTRTGDLEKTLEGNNLRVFSVKFSPDGATLASGGWDKIVRLWNAHTGELIRTLEGHSLRVNSVAFSPDGTTLASGADDKTVNLWNVHTGELIQTLRGAPGAVNSVVFSPDGSIIAGGIADNTVNLWDVHTSQLRTTLRGHAGGVLSVAFCPDGSSLATGSFDGTVKIWAAAPGRLLASLAPLPEGEASMPAVTATFSRRDLVEVQASGAVLGAKYLVTTLEGYYDGSPGADRYVRMRVADALYPAESFHARYYNPDLVKQALARQPLPPVGNFKGPVPPSIGFLAPAPDAHAAGDTIQVKLVATDDSDVKDIVFLLNGSRVAAPVTPSAPRAITPQDRRDILQDVPPAHRIAREFTATIPLPPNDLSFRLQAIAVDDDQLQSRRAEIHFTRDKLAPHVDEKLLALCVGVSQYQAKQLSLQYADKDATAMSGTLGQEKGTLYVSAGSSTLTNTQATHAAVIDALDSLIGRSTRADTVVVDLSGHGWRSQDKRFYFATYDINPDTNQTIAQTALPWDEMVQKLTLLSEHSKHVVVLLDACHSGGEEGETATTDDLVKALDHANAGVLVFGSSRRSEKSWEDPQWGHGAFTMAALEAIGGKAGKDGVITLDQFAEYVDQRVAELTKDAQHPFPFVLDFDLGTPLFTTVGGER